MRGSAIDLQALGRIIDGDVVVPDSPEYEAEIRVFNARFHEVRPQAIVRCANPHDVAEAISFIRRHGLEHAARSGGHSFAGHSTTRGVVIDASPMRSISVDGEVATVGAGARLGDVYDALDCSTISPSPPERAHRSGSPGSRWAAGSASSGGSTACSRIG